jgi:methionyl-tRNA formyltransferase
MSGSAPARLAYLGTSEFAATVLRRLASGAHRPALVVAPPDRRKGRGRRLSPPPAAATAEELGLELHQSANVNDPESLAALERAGIELGLVCAFGQFLKPELLGRLELLNVHPSLLPRWRGAAPIERAIMAGDEQTGVAIIRVTEDLDAGPVALCEEEPIRPDDDYGALSSRLADLGGDLAVRALDLRAKGSLEFAEQDHAAMTYAEKIDSAERLLHPRRPAVELERIVRALNPHIGSYLELEGSERLGVAGAVADPGAGVGAGALRAEPDALVLGCDPGALRITRVRPAGRREMTAAEYLRGHPAPRLAAPR